MLVQLEALPEGLLSCAATELHHILSGPTLIHLPGRRPQPLFISVLAHGNEHTGWEALRAVLQGYEGRSLPRALSIFIGNVEAAKANMRFLEGQADFNRIWGSSSEPAAPLMQEVLTAMAARAPFASIDIHNNTGLNPHYACLNVIDDRFLYLGHLFSRTMVYFTKPEGVQSMAFARMCPALTVESGLSGAVAGTEHVMEFIEACLHLSEFPARAFARESVNVFHTVGVCKIPPEYSVGFAEPDCQINFAAEVEYWNFRELPLGTALATIAPGIERPLIITNDHDVDVTDNYLAVQDKRLVTIAPCVAAMITRDLNAIRKDCFCYLMETYPL